jgi:hypothetical protein
MLISFTVFVSVALLLVSETFHSRQMLHKTFRQKYVQNLVLHKVPYATASKQLA